MPRLTRRTLTDSSPYHPPLWPGIQSYPSVHPSIHPSHAGGVVQARPAAGTRLPLSVLHETSISRLLACLFAGWLACLLRVSPCTFFWVLAVPVANASLTPRLDCKTTTTTKTSESGTRLGKTEDVLRTLCGVRNTSPPPPYLGTQLTARVSTVSTVRGPEAGLRDSILRSIPSPYSVLTA
jgi:hypothetical protein